MEEVCGSEQLFATKQFAEQSRVNSEEKNPKNKIKKCHQLKNI